jgi:hypothetical protein
LSDSIWRKLVVYEDCEGDCERKKDKERGIKQKYRVKLYAKGVKWRQYYRIMVTLKLVLRENILDWEGIWILTVQVRFLASSGLMSAVVGGYFIEFYLNTDTVPNIPEARGLLYKFKNHPPPPTTRFP